MADAKSKVKRACKEISFTVPWGVIAAKAWGPDDGKPFLGLHGYLDNANTFDRLAPLLPENIHFIAIDFPGHGKSSHRWPGMPYTHFEFIADVKKVVSQLGWEKFSVIGHSLGAHVASLYAGAFPDEVEKLIAIDIRPPSEVLLPKVISSDNPADVLAYYARQMSDNKTATPRIYKTVESAAERRQKTFLSYTLRKEDALLLTSRATKKTSDGVIFSHDPLLRALAVPFIIPHWSLISVLSKIQCAVLVLEATESKFFEDFEQARMEHLGVIYEHANPKMWKSVKGDHHAHLENPEQVALQIKEFLALCRSHDYSLQSKL